MLGRFGWLRKQKLQADCKSALVRLRARLNSRVRILPTRSSRFEPPNRSADAVVGQASRLSGEASIGCESSASLAAPPDRQDACPTTGFGGRVPDLADTEGPITESNCIGATPPGGEQLEVNRRNVVLGPEVHLFRADSDSAGRVCVRMRRNTGLRWVAGPDRGRPRRGQRVGHNRAAGAILASGLNRVPAPVHQATTDWKAGCGRPACPVWEGGEVDIHFPDPPRFHLLGASCMRVGKDGGAAPPNPAGEKSGRPALREVQKRGHQPATPSATPQDRRGWGRHCVQ